MLQVDLGVVASSEGMRRILVVALVVSKRQALWVEALETLVVVLEAASHQARSLEVVVKTMRLRVWEVDLVEVPPLALVKAGSVFNSHRV